MDRIQIPAYEFKKYETSARYVVGVCSAFELLMVMFGSLSDSNLLAELTYFVLAAGSLAVTVHNVSLDTDGREEIKKGLETKNREARARSAALVLLPAASAVFVFVCVSSHALFSLFVLVHVIAAVGQLGIEVYEVAHGSSKHDSKPKAADPLASPIRPPADKKAVAPTYDPQYQTLNNIHNEIFNKK